MLELFPQEIKQYEQWAVCGFHPGTSSEKQPYVWDDDLGNMVPLRKDGNDKKPSNLHLLMSFEDAERCVRYYNEIGHNLRLGFYLLPSDPFCCIDMDIKDTMSEMEKKVAGERYKKIVESFHSYTEISRSGDGLHTWIYSIPQAGKRRDGVEVYSQYRFIICTGDHWDITPRTVSGAPGSESEGYIANLIHQLMSEMSEINESDGFQMLELTEEDFSNDPYAMEDQDVYIQLCEQENGTLFKQLWEGRWRAEEVDTSIGERCFPSQSEAEFALIDFLCFKSKYNFQVRRLFMYSPMSSRYDDSRRLPDEKIKRPYHLDRMIRNYRYDAHVKSMGLMQIVQNNVNAAIERTEKLRQATTPERPPEEVLTTDGNYTEEQADGLAWPPGFMGEVARNMYKASLLPIKDISILSALALFSGMCGKAWNTVTRSGLNNYFVLIARSGIGKEAFRSNIETILSQVSNYGGQDGQQIFGIERVLDTSTYASDAALRKDVIMDTSVMSCGSSINYKTEVGAFFRNGKMEVGKAKDIMDEMLSLYDKGHIYAFSGGSKHSSKDNTTAGGKVKAYSFAGETTPDEFYGNVDDRMMSSGFMSRIIAWECTANRPLMNKSMLLEYPEAILRTIGAIYKQAVRIMSGTAPCYVEMEAEVHEAFDNLDNVVAKFLNSGNDGEQVQDEVIRQMYTRKALKVLRIASLLAVADNSERPVVTMEHYRWAESFIDQGNERFLEKRNSGQIGSTDSTSREKIMLATIKRFLDGEVKAYVYDKFPMFKDSFIVTRIDLCTYCTQFKAFKQTRNDNILQVIDNTIYGLMSMEVLAEMRPMDFSSLFGPDFVPPRMKCYLVDIERMEKIIKL